MLSLLIYGSLILTILLSLLNTLLLLHQIKNADVSLKNKVLAFCMDLFHNILIGSALPIIIIIIYLILIRRKYSVTLLLLIILLYIITIMFFFKYEMCILTIVYNELLNINPCMPYSFIQERLEYDSYASQYLSNDNKNCIVNTKSFMLYWKHGLLLIVALIIIYLLHYLGCTNRLIEILILISSLVIYCTRPNYVHKKNDNMF